MSKIRITKQFSFETGHALYGYDGKCKNVHGHSYKLSVTVIGTPILDTTNVKYGMVIDFSDLKKIVREEIVAQERVEEVVKTDEAALNFDWEIVTPTSKTIIEEKVEVVKYDLESPVEEKVVELNTRTVLSSEEQQRRAQERLVRIQEYTAKLKKADGISEFEKEPAYVRQNIQLDNSKYSSENKVSRFGLTNDENGTTLRGNNSFLHDNVD